MYIITSKSRNVILEIKTVYFYIFINLLFKNHAKLIYIRYDCWIIIFLSNTDIVISYFFLEQCGFKCRKCISTFFENTICALVEFIFATDFYMQHECFFYKNWICYLARASCTNIDTDVCTSGAVAIRGAFYPKHVCGRVSGAGMQMVSSGQSLLRKERSSCERQRRYRSSLLAARGYKPRHVIHAKLIGIRLLYLQRILQFARKATQIVYLTCIEYLKFC